MINTIKNKIIELLGGIDEMKGIYDYPETNPKGYPFMFVLWEGNESEELTNTQDSIYLNYKITLVQEKLEDFKGRKNAEVTAEDRAWQIETLFRENNDLGLGNVLRILPVGTAKRYDAQATRIILEIMIKVHIVENVKV
ncbi:MAG: hypothetical protein ACKKMS_00140 [Candidatus Nealsonbacteria bacterium]